ncbi:MULTISPECIES: ComF family protein [Corallincola]|uniref:ComF family protein n=2 Tax=Corallincola TaxID=1775176 RepID=A0A368NN88_9GAMM|nr:MULTISPECIES: double zinc ribbon domain-containing protein [Corallincola]RCU51124.1 ComF family protein [Corallincola holothuriorum]TAA46056.1 ComF family protein [Corallincola spongiicola]
MIKSIPGLQRLWRQIDLQLNNRCLLCQQPTVRLNHALCACCYQDLPRLPPGCQHCAEPLPQAKQQVCGRCQQHPPHYAKAIACLPYQPPIQGLLAQFKFNGDLACGQLLGSLMACHLRQQEQAALTVNPVLVPVPLHRKRLRQRQFNQSHLLAQVIASKHKLRLDSHLCQRTKNTQSQRELNAKTRKANVRGAFQVTRTLHGQSIAIIDDVMTTGATVNEMAKQLYRAGAAHVEVWCLARAAPPR